MALFPAPELVAEAERAGIDAAVSKEAFAEALLVRAYAPRPRSRRRANTVISFCAWRSPLARAASMPRA
jgi:hypothetical protein